MDKRSYPTQVLTSFITPALIRGTYTWPGKHNTNSHKIPLPDKVHRIIVSVCKHKLKNTSFSWSECEKKLRDRFSSWKDPAEVGILIYIERYLSTC